MRSRRALGPFLGFPPRRWWPAAAALVVAIVPALLIPRFIVPAVSQQVDPYLPQCCTQGGPWVGVLQAGVAPLPEERSAGVSVALLELTWDHYEPTAGAFDIRYIAEQRAKLRQLREAGFRVVLDVGLQYPPHWLFDNSDAYFVDQYGDRYRPEETGKASANGVFDPAVRRAEATYVGRVAHDFGDGFFAVRVGGGWYGELHYPPGSYAGNGNAYWAFDRNALRASPVSGWRPGTGTPADAQRFWNFYQGALLNYEGWQLSLYGHYFSGWLELLLPGWGLRPGDVDAAVQDLFSGRTQAQANGEAGQANGFSTEMLAIQDARTIVYSTWLEAPDHGISANLESPIRYLAALAAERGLRVAGENSAAGGSASDAALCLERTRSLPLAGMMWMGSPQTIVRELRLSR